MEKLPEKKPPQTFPPYRPNPPTWRERTPMLIGVLLAVGMAFFLIVPFFAMVWRLFTLGTSGSLNTHGILSAVILSLGTTTLSLIFILLMGTPLAYILARYKFPLKNLLSTFIEIPIVMPPVVAGLALLSTFGRSGIFGSALTELNLQVTFTLAAVVMTQVFVSAPFYIRAAQSRFEVLPREYEYAAAVDGASRWQIFGLIILPQSSRALLAGLILSWARALGEFGATILFAGNLQGRTQTMPLLVYSALERDLRVTFVTALILLFLALSAFLFTRWLTRIDAEEPV